MENGYVILGIIALLFLSMYGYSYLSVTLQKNKQKKAKLVEDENAKLLRQERLRNQEIRDEKIRQFNERKREIQHELMLLEKIKERQKVS
ncbi:hypothetical protein [uncultured Algibacter sp.]|uniref:hypothetical protein n=1 Tax=uncultured Algibacter sp. TaxID=298659 RepID=UPI00321648A0